MSPSDAVSSLINATLGPGCTTLGIGAGGTSWLRAKPVPRSVRASLSISICEMLPPPLSRTSTTRAFLADLRIPPFDEFADAGFTHVGHVDVAQAAVAHAIDARAIGRDPGQIQQVGLGSAAADSGWCAPPAGRVVAATRHSTG